MFDSVRVTKRCHKCGGIATADFDEKVWVCERGCKFQIKLRAGSPLIVIIKKEVDDGKDTVKSG